MAAFVGHGKVANHWQCIGGKHELIAYLEETTGIPIMFVTTHSSSPPLAPCDDFHSHSPFSVCIGFRVGFIAFRSILCESGRR